MHKMQSEHKYNKGMFFFIINSLFYKVDHSTSNEKPSNSFTWSSPVAVKYDMMQSPISITNLDDDPNSL